MKIIQDASKLTQKSSVSIFHVKNNLVDRLFFFSYLSKEFPFDLLYLLYMSRTDQLMCVVEWSKKEDE